MTIDYLISHLQDTYENGLVYKVEDFALALERFKKVKLLADNDKGYLRRAEELIQDMSQYEDNPKIYKHLAVLLYYYAREIADEAKSLGIELKRSNTRILWLLIPMLNKRYLKVAIRGLLSHRHIITGGGPPP